MSKIQVKGGSVNQLFLFLLMVAVVFGIANYIGRNSRETLENTVEKVMPSVVFVSSPTKDKWGQDSRSSASGFFIHPRVLVTAGHVAAFGPPYNIITHDGHKLVATRAIYCKKYDCALIYLDDLSCVASDCSLSLWNGNVLRGHHKVEFSPLPTADIKNCRVGQSVFSIGSTFGQGNMNAVSLGIIQVIGNQFEAVNGMTEKEGWGWSVLFSITAPGTVGNSGCPVFTMDGEVLGIWVGGQPEVNFMIPITVFLDDMDVILHMFRQDNYRIGSPNIKKELEYILDTMF